MDISILYVVCAALAATHILLNFFLTREIIHWISPTGKQITYLMLLWLIPIAGLIIMFRRFNLVWFKKPSESDEDQQSVGNAFLEMDTLFNPGQKYAVEVRQENKVQKTREDSSAKKKD